VVLKIGQQVHRTSVKSSNGSLHYQYFENMFFYVDPNSPPGLALEIGIYSYNSINSDVKLASGSLALKTIPFFVCN
jgi:hypothetical protein